MSQKTNFGDLSTDILSGCGALAGLGITGYFLYCLWDRVKRKRKLYKLNMEQADLAMDHFKQEHCSTDSSESV